MFIITPERNLKKATQKLLQRLRKRSCEVADDEGDTFGWPPKVARTRIFRPFGQPSHKKSTHSTLDEPPSDHMGADFGCLQDLLCLMAALSYS